MVRWTRRDRVVTVPAISPIPRPGMGSMTSTSRLRDEVCQNAEPQPTLVLLERVRRGDAAAINGLLERHREAIKLMIGQIGRAHV